MAGYRYKHMHLTYVASNEVALQTGAWWYGVHGTCSEMVAISRGTSHATTKQRCQYTTSEDTRERERDRDRERDRETQTDRQTDRDRERDREREKSATKMILSLIQNHRYIYIDRYIYIYIDKRCCGDLTKHFQNTLL